MKQLLKGAYKRVPFKRAAFSLARKFWVPPFYKRLHFHGSFHIAVPGTPGFFMQHYERCGLETEFFWKGINEAWEVVSLAAWVRLCADAGVILDIGASEGIYALISKCVNPSSRVFAFEPFPTAFQVLRQNVALNRYDIECLPFALSDYEGTADFFSPPGEMPNEGSLIEGPGKPIRTPVRVVKLSSVIEQLEITKIDLMKVDVEGADPEVLKGMGEFLHRFKPSILIEVLTESAAKRIDQLISGLDYVYFDIDDNRSFGTRFIRRSETLRKGACLNYLLVPGHRARGIDFEGLYPIGR